jgi:hypothetical protein
MTNEQLQLILNYIDAHINWSFIGFLLVLYMIGKFKW